MSPRSSVAPALWGRGRSSALPWTCRAWDSERRHGQRRRQRERALGRIRVRLLLASSSVAALLIGGGAPAALADGCCAWPFPYTNNGTVHCIVVNNTSFSGNLVNSGTGTISPGEPTGVGVNNSTITGQIFNAGTGYLRAAPGILIKSNSVLTSGISNSGTISAGGDGGIYIDGISTFAGGNRQLGHVLILAAHGVFWSVMFPKRMQQEGSSIRVRSSVPSPGSGTAIVVLAVGTFFGGMRLIWASFLLVAASP